MNGVIRVGVCECWKWDWGESKLKAARSVVNVEYLCLTPSRPSSSSFLQTTTRAGDAVPARLLVDAVAAALLIDVVLLPRLRLLQTDPESWSPPPAPRRASRKSYITYTRALCTGDGLPDFPSDLSLSIIITPLANQSTNQSMHKCIPQAPRHHHHHRAFATVTPTMQSASLATKGVNLYVYDHCPFCVRGASPFCA
jgi:hypothetical protein